MEHIEQAWMEEALCLAREGQAKGEVPVGAVIVRNGQVIARAHNQTEGDKLVTAHAELLVIKRASEILHNWRLDDCQLVVTLEPCPMCIGAILLARIRELYFGCFDPEFGAVGSLFDLSVYRRSSQELKVYSGILEHDCRGILRDFFKSKRT